MERAHTVAPIIVHKEGEEGTLAVDALSGAIVTEIDQRPEWSEGLAVALLAERNTFYETRFGKGSDQLASVMSATSIEFQDLGWIGVNADQDEIEIEANTDHRSEVVAKALNIDTESGSMGDDVTAEREIDAQNTRLTASQAKALEEAGHQGFGSQASEERKQATN